MNPWIDTEEEQRVRSADIVVQKLNEVTAKIECEDSISMELADFFTFKVPGAEWSPGVRAGWWDGTIKLYKALKHTIPLGLVDRVEKFAKDRNYTFRKCWQEATPSAEFQIQHSKAILSKLKRSYPHDPYKHQLQAWYVAIRRNKICLISPTASGKSLIIHLVTEYHDSKRFLIIVPTIGLVKQMQGDLIDYGQDPDKIQIIMQGYEKEINPNTRIVISTWHSLVNQPKSWFQQFQGVIGDECHGAKAKELSKIMEALTKCDVRIGLTGSLDDIQANRLTIEGHFGPIVVVEKTKNLMDKGIIAPLQAHCLVLQYSKADREKTKGLPYHDEIEFLCLHEQRRKFIKELALKMKGNTIVLFQRVESHGVPIYEMIKREAGNRKVFLVYGGTQVEDREAVRAITETEQDAIIVASVGCFATGTNIKNLTNAICAAPTKSIIRTLQSIGRILRKHEDKPLAHWYDIADDLSNSSKKNYTLKHFNERMQIYKRENFDVKVSIIKLS